MTKRALLIGSQVGGLEGVDADIVAMTRTLDAWGFSVEALTGPSATRRGILAAYEQLIEVTQSDDVVVVYYSGHGGYTDDPSASSGLAAAFHQFILPTDFYSVSPGTGEFRGIMNVELSHLQAQLTKKTNNVVTILDCCHSARMSRGDLSRARGTMAVEWRATVDAFARKLRDEGRVPDAHLMQGNPNAVRLVACGQQQQAFEPRGGDPGYFTDALTAALLGARATESSITWRQLMQRVRDGVLTHVPSQSPELEGPGDRKLFETATAELTGVLRLGERNGKKMLRGGRIMGVELGDEYLVMKAGAIEAAESRAVARAMVRHVEAGWAAVELASMNGSFGVPDDAQAFPWRKHVRRGVVAVEGGGPLADRLRAEITASGRLALHDEDAPTPTMARVVVGAQELVIFDAEAQPWLLPIPAREAELAKIVTNLGIMAKAEALRRMESGQGSEALGWPLALEWGRVVDEHAAPLARTDERVNEGESVYLKLTNPAGSPSRVFVSIFDIGLTGKVTLVSDSGSTGVEILPGEHAGVGLHPYFGIVGLGPVSWPDAAPRNAERRESLLVIATREPHDFTGLEGAGATRGKGTRSGLESMMQWIERGGTRDVPRETATASIRFAVERIDFLVVPSGLRP